MSLKSLVKTRWKIEPDSVTIYPYGLFYILAPVMAVFGAVLLFLYIHYQNSSLSASLPLVLFVVLIVVLMWGAANTHIAFNNRQGRMRKMLFGFIPTVTIPFAEIQGIDVVSHITTGSYNYSAFRKSARHGKGIVVSSGYTKNDDPNAIAFVNEAVPVIHAYLDKYDRPEGFVQQPLTSFKYFEHKGNTYVIKKRKAATLITGLIFIAIGFWLFTIPVDSLAAMLICIALFFLFGLVFINAAFTDLIFDPQAQTVTRKGLFRFWNRNYSFENFAGVQTIRHTMNFIYVRTSVNLHFEVPGKNGKQDILTVASLFRGKSIDRFIQEFYQIMDKRNAQQVI